LRCGDLQSHVERERDRARIAVHQSQEVDAK
jgi:hypothetical protein